jgi:plastocyanin
MIMKWATLLKLAATVSTLTVFALAAGIYGAHVARAANATIGAGDAAGDTVFVPNVATISSGDSVTFTWVNGVHDARNAATDQIYLPLSTGAASQASTFNTAGTYYFYCSIHAKASDATDANIAAGTKMVGKIVVTAAASPTSTATATATATSTPTATATTTATSTPTSTPTTRPPAPTPTVPPTATVASASPSVAPRPPSTGSGLSSSSSGGSVWLWSAVALLVGMVALGVGLGTYGYREGTRGR